MSFRGTGSGARGFTNSRGRGGARGGRPNFQAGPPANPIEAGTFVHSVENQMVFRSSLDTEQIDKVPMFGSHLYFENRAELGRIDEVFGMVYEVFFSVNPAGGIAPDSLKDGDKAFIDPMRAIPKDRFKPKPKSENSADKAKRKAAMGDKSSRGGRGAPRGTRAGRGGIRGSGAPRGGARGRGGGITRGRGGPPRARASRGFVGRGRG